jgi:hypothetical protein
MRRDATDPLNRAREWRVFVQRSVRSQIVVIAGIGLHRVAPAQHSASFMRGMRSRAQIQPEAERTLAFAHGFRGTAWAKT